MNSDTIYFLICFGLPPVIVILAQIVLNRIYKIQSRQKTTIVGMLLGYIIFFTILDQIPFSIVKNEAFYTYMFFLYSFSAYTYFHVFNMSETARRIRLIMYVGSKGTTTDEDLKKLYIANDMLQIRMERLLALGQIRVHENKYFLSSRMPALIVQMIYLAGRIVNRPWPEAKKFKESLVSEKK